MKLFLSSLGGQGQAGNPPETEVPVGSPSVTIMSTKIVAPDEPDIVDGWKGRPVMKELPGGIWICIYAQSEAHHKLVYSRLHVIFSDDYGETWTAENTYLDGSPVQGAPLYPPTCPPGVNTRGPGDGWIIVCPNGDLLCGMWDSDYVNLNYGSYQSRSTDGGRSWSTPEFITWGGVTNNLACYNTCDDVVIGDTIYQGIREQKFINQSQNAGIRNGIAKSTDNGQTWNIISYTTDWDLTPSNEIGFEYVGGTNMVANSRGTTSTANGGPYKETFLSFSNDMGETWSAPIKPANLQVNGRCRMKTRSHVKNKDRWWEDPVVFLHGFKQQNVPISSQRQAGIWVSKDRGQTWSTFLPLYQTTYDGGYGDFLYNPIKDEYVTMQYMAYVSLYDGEVRQINWKLNWV